LWLPDPLFSWTIEQTNNIIGPGVPAGGGPQRLASTGTGSESDTQSGWHIQPPDPATPDPPLPVNRGIRARVRHSLYYIIMTRINKKDNKVSKSETDQPAKFKFSDYKQKKSKMKMKKYHLLNQHNELKN
jgi:hypothetical protein